VIPCDHSYETPGGPEYGSHTIYSDDLGKSWKLGGVIRPKMNECQVVELADGNGTLLMNLRSYFGLKQRAISTSHDGGISWSEPSHDPQLIEPVCQASILRFTWPGIKNKSRILFSNPADKDRRKNMTVRLSYDEGKTWPVSRSLHESFAAYSCLTALKDNSIACLYECGEKSATDKITFARFTLDWLTDSSEGRVPQVPLTK
jgi:sialidase-1